MKIEDLHFDLPTETVDEENWDLEKWRKEHPMDYFKALHILNMSDDSIVKAEVFKAIYRVIRMHIPDVLCLPVHHVPRRMGRTFFHLPPLPTPGSRVPC